MNKQLQKGLLIAFAFIGFYLMFIAPDSVWMDAHQKLYWPAIATGAALWVIGFVWLAKAFKKGQW